MYVLKWSVGDGEFSSKPTTSVFVDTDALADFLVHSFNIVPDDVTNPVFEIHGLVKS